MIIHKVPAWIVVLLFIAVPASGIHHKINKKNEKHYQEIWCTENGGKTEVIMPDKTRADCITKDQAVEVDFASKKLLAIGQALNYAKNSDLQAAIVLIIKHKRDLRHLKILQENIDKYALNFRMKVFLIDDNYKLFSRLAYYFDEKNKHAFINYMVKNAYLKNKTKTKNGIIYKFHIKNKSILNVLYSEEANEIVNYKMDALENE